jgi:hypothetical protein
MRRVLQVVSWIALGATILPSVVFLANQLTLDQTKWVMLAATVVWFVVTPLWMGRVSQEHDDHQTANV